MKLEDLLVQRRSTIIDKWSDLVVETYPPDTAKFLKAQRDRFANPVGAAIAEGVEGLFDELVRGIDREKASAFLDNIIRIRAIQDFTPSQALCFVLLLKKVVRKVLRKELREVAILEELLGFESNIDELALLSFDIYMSCREKIYEIRVNELKRSPFRPTLVCKIPGQDPDQKEGSTANETEPR